MCRFFSFVSDPNKPIPERFMFMDWSIRQKILAGKLNYEADSHTSIADFHGYKGELEDQLNKYEYNPLLGIFTVDQINNQIDDSADGKKWVQALSFKKVAPIVIKPIINPFKIIPPEITPIVLELLKQWASVRTSVGNSLWASLWAYCSSFFIIKYKHDFSPAVKLWEMGLVASRNKGVGRLHGGEKAEVLWEGNKGKNPSSRTKRPQAQNRGLGPGR